MIDIHFWTTPNGYKVLLYLEESGLNYNIVPVNISTGEQFTPKFLKVSPNHKIPAITDRRPAGGGEPLSLFESGAILEYLADKTGLFLARSGVQRYQTLQWLHWQVAGLGPMLGQNLHFGLYAPEHLPYAVKRYRQETARLFRVLDGQLARHNFVSGDNYTIADMAVFPWARKHPVLDVPMYEFEHVERWLQLVSARPATQRAYEIGSGINTQPTVTGESAAVLLGQTGADLPLV